MPAENRPLFRGDHLRAIGNAVQRGAFIFIYDEKGFKTGTAPAGSGEDGLKGYTSSTVNDGKAVTGRITKEEKIMAAKKKAKTRRSPADIKKAWQKLEPELAKHKREHERQGETFTSITREEFEAKMKRIRSR